MQKPSPGGCAAIFSQRERCFLSRRARTFQTAIAAQRQSLITAQRPGAEGGQFAAQIGLVKRPEPDVQPREARENIQQFDFGANAAEDEIGVLLVRRNESVACSLDGRMAGLKGLLGKRKIGPDKDVNVGRFAVCRLPEVQGHHVKLSSKWQTLFWCRRKCKGRAEGD